MADVLAELRVSNPGRAQAISLNDADVRALAGMPSGQITMANLRGKSSYVPLSLVGASGSSNVSSVASSGTSTCSPGVTVSGGSGGYSYAWSIVSQSGGCTLGNTNAQRCSISHSYAKNTDGSASATLQCVVTDGTGRSAAVNVSAFMQWYSNK